jgi:hypothetical protein
MRITSLVIFLLCLTACGEQKRIIHQIGVITHTEYWVTEPLRWEGSGRHYEYAELCSPKLSTCLEGKFIELSEYRSAVGGKLAATFQEESDYRQANSEKARSYIFDTKSGYQISCENCNNENLSYGDGAWLRDGSIFIPLKHSRNSLDENKKIYIIEFILKGMEITAKQRTITLKGFKSNEGFFISFSPSLRTAATIKCDPKCVIYWLNEDLTGFKSKPTGCASEKLFIVWNGDEPEAVFSNWAQAKDICLDKNGKPMFRQITYEEYLALPKPGFGGNDNDRHPVWETKNSP